MKPQKNKILLSSPITPMLMPSFFAVEWCRWASMVLMVLAFVSVLAKFPLLSTFPELRMMETIGFIRPGTSSTMQQNMVSEGGSNYLTQIQEGSRADCYFFLHFLSCKVKKDIYKYSPNIATPCEQICHVFNNLSSY